MVAFGVPERVVRSQIAGKGRFGSLHRPWVFWRVSLSARLSCSRKAALHLWQGLLALENHEQ